MNAKLKKSVNCTACVFVSLSFFFHLYSIYTAIHPSRHLHPSLQEDGQQRPHVVLNSKTYIQTLHLFDFLLMIAPTNKCPLCHDQHIWMYHIRPELASCQKLVSNMITYLSIRSEETQNRYVKTASYYCPLMMVFHVSFQSPQSELLKMWSCWKPLASVGEEMCKQEKTMFWCCRSTLNNIAEEWQNLEKTSIDVWRQMTVLPIEVGKL